MGTANPLPLAPQQRTKDTPYKHGKHVTDEEVHDPAILNSPVSIGHLLGNSTSESGPSQRKDASSASASTSSEREAHLPSPTASSADVRTFSAPLHTNAAAIIQRLKQPIVTGQVVAWAWDQTARLSQTKRSPPVALIAALWPALHGLVCKLTAQDVLEIMEAWMVLLQAWPRHFRLVQTDALTDFTTFSMPAAVKRMSEQRLAQLATLTRDISLHQIDIALSSQPGGKTSSARDLMQPIYSLVATETAWRVSNAARYVSPATTSIVLNASAAWRWAPVRGRDGAALLALKRATRGSLEVLKSHNNILMSNSLGNSPSTSPPVIVGQ